jgi:tRNA dimethylallyltransferase
LRTPLPDSDTSLLPRLIVLVGPTAVGKTELAIQLAENIQAEIISADSRLFYTGMDIGTAKPTALDRQRVRHHLIDVTRPDETWSLAVFQEAAHCAVLEIHKRGHLPLLVGGTGQYIRAVTEGWRAPAVIPDPALRQVLSRLADEIGSQELHQRLAILDPDAAANIDYRNVRRTMRALEVILTSGKRFSTQRQRSPSPYHTLVLGLTRPRAELFARIDARVQTMLTNGWIDEVRALLAEGYAPDLPAFSAIGYREIIAHLQGKITLDEAVALICRQSRVFVRRQANWFKLNDSNIQWVQADDEALPRMLQLIRDWLKLTEKYKGLD